jgi:hypothetical protein
MGFYGPLDGCYQEIGRWRQKNVREILEIPFSNSIEFEVVRKFEKIATTVEAYAKLSMNYRQTVERLGKVQKKLEEYVLIMQSKDTRALYRLML